MKHTKRILSALLAAALLLSLLPAAAFAAEPRSGGVTIDVTEYGADPTGIKESSTAVISALEYAKTLDEDVPKTIRFPQGEYHFYADYSEVRELYVSNTVGTNQAYKNKHLGILVEDMENVTIDGGGSQFIYHGDITAFAAIRSKNVTFTNFDMDHASPSVVDVTVESRVDGENAVILYVPPCYTYSISGTTITWKGETGPVTGTPYWQGNNNLAYQQGMNTIDGHTRRGTGGPFSNVSSIQELGNSRLKVTYSGSNLPTVGMCYQLRNTTRTTPGTFFWESEDVTVSNVDIQFLHGFGMVGQLSKNITLDRVNFAARPGTGRTTAGFADFVQMSSVGGKVTIRNCSFSNPHDDPINVHGTFLRVTEVSNENKTFKLRYQHNETGGFPQYYVGDTVDFSAQGSMVPVADSAREVVSVVNPGEGDNDLNTITITLDRPVDGITANNYVVENVTYTPEVLIENCRFAETPTRGILVTTRRPVVIRNNYFDRMGMAAIFISCDAAGWWESGRTEDVTIENNVFHINSSHAVFVEPTGNGGTQGSRVHKNMKIRNNTVYMWGNIQPFNIKSVDGLTIEGNTILRYNPNAALTLSAASNTVAVGAAQATSIASSASTYTAQVFQLNSCDHVAITNNTYDDGLNLGVGLSGTAASDVTVTGDSLTVGGSNQLPAVGTVRYFSSSPAIAAVDESGTVTGVSAGTAEIYAYTVAGGRVFESNHLTFTVTGGSSASVEKIDVAGANTVDVGGTLNLTATVTPSTAGSAAWSVKPATDGAAASISQQGELTGTAPGVVEVSATLGGVSGSKLVTVNTPTGGLSSAWSVEAEVPGTWSLDNSTGKVTIQTQGGGDWATGPGGHNYFLTSAPTGNFEAVVKLDNKTCGNGNCWCETGLILYKDTNNYISVVRKNNGGTPKLAVNSESGGNPSEGTLLNDAASAAIYLKLTKSGTSYSGYYSTNGTDWTAIRTVSNDISDYRVGFMAINAGNGHGGASSTLGDFKITQNGATTSVPLVSANTAPTVTNVTVASASPMTVSYTYSDADNDAESSSLIAWYVSDTQDGHYTRLENASGSSLAVTAATSEKWIKAVVVPRDATGRYGAPAVSNAVHAPAQTPVQNDATLQSLSVAGVALSPAFDPNVTAYTIDIPRSVESVTVSAAASQAAATVAGAGVVALTGTQTVANVTVTAPNGTTAKTYTVTIRRAGSSSAELSSLTAVAGNEITYVSGTRFYQLTASEGSSALRLTAAAADPNATIAVRFNGEEKGAYTSAMSLPLAAGLNHLELRVTAEDGVSTALYRVVVLKPAANNAGLASLQVNGENALDGEGLVRLDGDTAVISAAAADPKATVRISVDGRPLENGSTITLTKATANVNVRVVAENTVTEKTYSLVLAKRDRASADLAALKLDGPVLSPAFDPSVTEYTATAYGNASAALDAIATQEDAVITYETVAEYGTGTGQVNPACRFFGDEGLVNQVAVTVASPDGKHTKTYTITVDVVDSVYLSDLNWESATSGWRTVQKDREVEGDGRQLKLLDANGTEVTFEKGLGTHANSVIVYDLSAMGFTRLTAKVGMDHSQSSNTTQSLNFYVDTDVGNQFTRTGLKSTSSYEEVDVDITGARELTLRAIYGTATDANAHADWADAKLSSTIPLLSNTDVAISHITFAHDSHTLYANQGDPAHTTQLHPVIKPSGVDQSAHQKVLTWTSSDPSVATVAGGADNHGVVTAVGVGTATITATALSGATAACEIIVKQKLVGQAAVSGETKFDSELTADINDIAEAAKSHLTYQWYRGETAEGSVLGTEKTYTPVQADIGSKLTVKVTANDPYEGSTTFTTAVIEKADGPIITGAGASGIHGEAASAAGNDGKIVGFPDDDGHTYEWKAKDDPDTAYTEVTGTEVTGLDVGDYNVRIQATDTHKAGIAITVTVSPHDVTEYMMTIGQITPAGSGNTITRFRGQAAEGETRTLVIRPAEGYQLAELTVTGDTSQTVIENVEPGNPYLDETDGKTYETYTFAMPAENVTVTATFEKKTYTIDHELEHITCDMAEHNHTVTYGDTFTITLTPDEGYEMPRSLTVTDTDTEERFTDYTYTADPADPDKRVLTFAHGVTRNITVSGEAVLKHYTVVYELTNGLTAPDAPQSVSHHGALSVTLTAARGYRLPDSIAVTVNGTAFDEFDYDPETGTVEIAADKINGSVVITAVGETIGVALQSVAVIGPARVGRTLAVNTVPVLATVNYQWILVDENGTETPFDGATEARFVIPEEAQGKTIKVRVTGTGGYSGTMTSAPTATVLSEAEPFVFVETITLDPVEASVDAGKTVQIGAAVKPDNATSGVLYWFSSNDAIATVDQNGLVTGVAEGTAVITARSTDTVNFVSAECVVTVTAGEPLPDDPDPVVPVTPGNPGGGTTTTTTTNPDGSTTTTVTDKKTGAVTATTEKPDGSKEIVETKPDGTVTETKIDTEGAKTEKVTDPDKNVAITVTGKDGEVLAKVELPAEIPAPETRFVDVPEGHWADESIHNMAAMEIVKGVGGNRFDMNSSMTRGALATILSRLSNGQEGLESSFADVAADKWYADGIAWAAKTGVVTGYSESKFGPEDTITREQLAVMLRRYARLLGMDTTADSAGLDAFDDGSSTHNWAVDSVSWCVANGILKGKGSGTLAPTATATRAEVAVMLQRFMDLMK